jgi:hypothetical protein
MVRKISQIASSSKQINILSTSEEFEKSWDFKFPCFYFQTQLAWPGRQVPKLKFCCWQIVRVRMNMFSVKKLHLKAASPMRFKFYRSTTMNSFSPFPELVEV